MKNPDKNGNYDCPQCSSRKKNPYPTNPIDEPCAKCIRKTYKLPENK